MFMKSDKVKIRYSGIPEVSVINSMLDPKVKVMKLKKLARRKKKRKKKESVNMNNGIDNDDESDDKKRTMKKSSPTKLMLMIKILASMLICNGVTLSDAVPLNSGSETEIMSVVSLTLGILNWSSDLVRIILKNTSWFKNLAIGLKT